MNDRTPPPDRRQIHVPAPSGGPADAPPPRVAPRPSPAPRAAGIPRDPARNPARSASAPRGPAAPARRGKRRRFLPHRPKLRRVLLLLPILLPLLVLAGVIGSYLYARSVYDKIDKIEVSEVLSSSGGGGTNYLIVGSDSRDPQAIIDAGLNPDAFEGEGGQRSDTMLLLRLEGGQAKLLSIPRDLYVEIAETGAKQKINAAFNGGPGRLIQTVQAALGVPVHHYLQIDFVSFAQLVNALGGITIDFPHEAIDRQSGLWVQKTGPVELDGDQALAYVRSRNYTETIDGRQVTEPTGDLGRVKRQQAFLAAVFSKLGDSRNPLALARAANGASSGLGVDDSLGLTEAARLAWKLRSLEMAPVELPVENGRNASGAVLFLVQPAADDVLAQFR